MHRFVLITGSLLCFGAVSACGTAAATDGPAIEEHWMPYAEAAALVAFLNDTDVATELMLDEQCAIRSDAAVEIVKRRGERPFVDGADVESVYRVGPATMELLLRCAADQGYVPVERDLELLAFLNDRNQTDLERLDSDCGLRRDTAEQILLHRNGKDGLAGTLDDNRFETVSEIDAVYGVGEATVSQLRACASWFQSLPQSGPVL